MFSVLPDLTPRDVSPGSAFANRYFGSDPILLLTAYPLFSSLIPSGTYPRATPTESPRISTQLSPSRLSRRTRTRRLAERTIRMQTPPTTARSRAQQAAVIERSSLGRLRAEETCLERRRRQRCQLGTHVAEAAWRVQDAVPTARGAPRGRGAC